MNRAEAEQIAAAVTLIRPDWLRTSLVTLLGKHQHRPARDVMLALVWVAFDPDTKGPGRIDADGPWWLTARSRSRRVGQCHRITQQIGSLHPTFPSL